MESSLDNRETRYASERSPKHKIQKLNNEAKEITQIMVDNVLLKQYSTVWYSTVPNILQKKATDRGNYLKEVSSQSETVKI